jgi:pilus assembly protein CpaB
MNSRAFTLSFVIAAVAMFMVYSYMDGKEKTYIEKYGNELPVVVAKVDINELELLDDSKVTITKFPKTFLAPGHIKDIKEVYNTIATVPILKGEQITIPRITYPGSGTGLSRQVSIGKRAFSISVSETAAVGKLIKPGDRVDILAVPDYSGGRKDLPKSKTILQDVLVLSTGLSITNSIPMVTVKSENDSLRKLKLNNFTNYNTVTLELDPFQVQKMVFLNWLGATVTLSLRNNDDKKVVRIQGTRLFDVLDEDAAEAKSYFMEQDALRKGAK